MCLCFIRVFQSFIIIFLCFPTRSIICSCSLSLFFYLDWWFCIMYLSWALVITEISNSSLANYSVLHIWNVRIMCVRIRKPHTQTHILSLQSMNHFNTLLNNVWIKAGNGLRVNVSNGQSPSNGSTGNLKNDQASKQVRERERHQETKQNVAWCKIFIFGQNQIERIVCTVGQSFNCSAAMLKVF